MWNRFVIRLVHHALTRADLTLDQRNQLVIHCLDRLEALPLRDIITNSDEGILINGRPADIDKLRTLRNAAQAVLDNQAFNFIGEQVLWVAVQNVVHKATQPDQIYFYRAAIWFVEQMKAHLQMLAGTQELPL